MADGSPLDYAGLEAAATTAVAEAPVVETPTTETVETPKVETPGSETTSTETTTTVEEKNADGTPKTLETKPAAQVLEPTAQNVRNYLKTLKSDPSNAKIVKAIHEGFEHQRAYQEVYPTVQEARDAKDLIEAAGGLEGLQKKDEIIQSVTASDDLLYAGDPKLIEQIRADLKSEGKEGALVSLTPAFLEAVKSIDEKGYQEAMAPHFLGMIEYYNLNGAVAGLFKVLSAVDTTKPETLTAAVKAIEEAKGISNEMNEWVKGLQTSVQTKKTQVETPEAKKFKEQQEAFNKQKMEFETNKSNEFKNAVANEAESTNNKTLGAELGPYLKMPYFQGFSKDNLKALGNELKSNLYETLKADKTYQAWMTAAWGAKSPDRSKILEYHKVKVGSLAAGIVQRTVEGMYPTYAKGGKAAVRTAAVAAKKEAVSTAVKTATAAGKAIYVAQKPPRDFIDYTDKNQADMYLIAGKAKLSKPFNNIPVGTLVTWRK